MSTSGYYPWIDRDASFEDLFKAASADKPSKIVSFVGNQQVGKSTLIRSLIRHHHWTVHRKEENIPDGPLPNNTGGKLPCSANIAAYPVAEYWFLDFEGLNAEEIPSQVFIVTKFA